MDELEISGKRYLSSKRAAKENKYHADYIGQLIRAGKVVGTKVGRAWYVEAASLDEYLANEFVSAQGAPLAPVARPTTLSMPHASVQTEKVFSIPVKKEVPHIQLEKEVETTKHTPLRYIADEGPVFPVVQKTSHIYDAREFAPTPKVMPQHIQSTPRTSRPAVSKVALVAITLLCGGVTFAVVLFASAKLLSVVTVEQGKPAIVEFSFK